MLPTDVPDDALRTLMGLIDAALPECYWKRLFNLKWMETRSIDAAFAAWDRGPIRNPEYRDRVAQQIEEMKRGYSVCRGSQG